MIHLIAGGTMHETHTFSAETTPLEVWTIARGTECEQYAGTNHSVGGVIDACHAVDVDLTHTFFAQATASGSASSETFESMLDELLAGIEHALPADGIVLTLHGAMVTEGCDDAEAELVRGSKHLPARTSRSL